MREVVLWSIVMGLTPFALGLAWGLIRGVGRLVELMPCRALGTTSGGLPGHRPGERTPARRPAARC